MGREQRGARPVLVVSATAFDNATNMPVILPITNGGGFASGIGFATPISGIKTTGVVRCDQPRMIDLAARGGRVVDHLPGPILADVLARVKTIFN
jgi:mRNA interferase ChpB